MSVETGENVNQSEHILVARSPWMTLCITENHKGTASDKLSSSFYQAGLDSSGTGNISQLSLALTDTGQTEIRIFRKITKHLI